MQDGLRKDNTNSSISYLSLLNHNKQGELPTIGYPLPAIVYLIKNKCG